MYIGPQTICYRKALPTTLVIAHTRTHPTTKTHMINYGVALFLDPVGGDIPLKFQDVPKHLVENVTTIYAIHPPGLFQLKVYLPTSKVVANWKLVHAILPSGGKFMETNTRKMMQNNLYVRFAAIMGFHADLESHPLFAIYTKR